MITESEIQKILAGDKELYIKRIEPYIENVFCITKAFSLNDEKVEEIMLKTFTNTYNSLSEKKNIDLVSIFNEHFRLLSNSIQTNSSMIPQFLETYIFLLSEIQQCSTKEISHIIGISKEEVDYNYQSAIKNICGESLQTMQSTETCISIDKLIAFSIHNEDKTIEDHLEFCPNCREKIKKIESIKQKYVRTVNETVVEDSPVPKLIKELPSLTIKKCSWKKQTMLASIVVAVFAAFIFLLPNILHWKTAVTNYIKYGELYNAWGEDTFTVSDAGITFTVNKVEVSPEYLIVHYSLKEELGEEREVRSNNNRNPQYWGKLIDGEKEHFLSAVNIPLLDKSESVLLYSISQVDHIPDSFDLQIAIREMENVIGNWDVTVPVTYAPFIDSREVITLDATYNILDMVELQLKELIYTPTGISLDLEMDITDNEIKRLLGESIIENGEDLRESVIRRNLALNPILSMVDQHGRELLPIYTTEYSNINNKQKRFTFSPFLADLSGINLNFWGLEETTSLSIEDKVNRDSELNIQINEVYYFAQIINSIDIPLREVEDLPLDMTMNGDNLDTLTVRKLEPNGNYSRGSYEILIKSKNADESVRSSYNWTASNQDMNRWFHSTSKLDFDPLKNDPGVFLHIELVIEEDMPEEIMLASGSMTRVIQLNDPIKVPLKNYGF